MRIGLGSLDLGSVGWPLVVGAALLLSPSLGCGGSQLRAGVVYDYPVYYVNEPVRVQRYPSVYYRGRPAYLVDRRWYYSTPRGWVVFREEPRELRTYRQRIDRSSARRGERYREPPRAEPTERRRYRDRVAEPASPTERRRRSAGD